MHLVLGRVVQDDDRGRLTHTLHDGAVSETTEAPYSSIEARIASGIKL